MPPPIATADDRPPGPSWSVATHPPELVLPAKPYHPLHARWRMKLDAPADVEVYVGLLRGELSVPAAAQPTATPLADPGLRGTVARKAAVPVAFEAADFNP